MSEEYKPEFQDGTVEFDVDFRSVPTPDSLSVSDTVRRGVDDGIFRATSDLDLGGFDTEGAPRRAD